MIPNAAVDAALRAAEDRYRADDPQTWEAIARAALEAAAPHMLNLAKREAWDANLEIQRLRAELAEAAK